MRSVPPAWEAASVPRKIGVGELSAVNGLCAAIGPNASVIILDSLTADRFAQVVRGICGDPAAVLA